ARELCLRGQLARRKVAVAQVAEHLVLAVREVELRQGLLEGAADTAAQPDDPVDDPLDLEVDRREAAQALEHLVYMVTLDRRFHIAILSTKFLDVKASG